jgi:hypothetical protein
LSKQFCQLCSVAGFNGRRRRARSDCIHAADCARKVMAGEVFS